MLPGPGSDGLARGIGDAADGVHEARWDEPGARAERIEAQRLGVDDELRLQVETRDTSVADREGVARLEPAIDRARRRARAGAHVAPIAATTWPRIASSR